MSEEKKALINLIIFAVGAWPAAWIGMRIGFWLIDLQDKLKK